MLKDELVGSGIDDQSGAGFADVMRHQVGKIRHNRKAGKIDPVDAEPKIGNAVVVESGLEDEGIIALATGQEIAAGSTRKMVVACVAEKLIIASVAGGVDIFAAKQPQPFDIGLKLIAVRGLYRVEPLAGKLPEPVTGIIDDHRIVSHAAPDLSGQNAAAIVKKIIAACHVDAT